MDELERRRRTAMAQQIVDNARERLARLYGVGSDDAIPTLADLLELVAEDARHG